MNISTFEIACTKLRSRFGLECAQNLEPIHHHLHIKTNQLDEADDAGDLTL